MTDSSSKLDSSRPIIAVSKQLVEAPKHKRLNTDIEPFIAHTKKTRNKAYMKTEHESIKSTQVSRHHKNTPLEKKNKLNQAIDTYKLGKFD